MAKNEFKAALQTAFASNPLPLLNELGLKIDDHKSKAHAIWCHDGEEQVASLQIGGKDGFAGKWSRYGTNESGDGFALVQRQRPGTDFKEALRIVADAYGIADETSAVKAPTREIGRIIYEVREADGTLVAKHHRIDYADKSKRIWWTGHNTKRPLSSFPLYRLPELLHQATGSRVILTEGEKACDALRQSGLTACGTYGTGILPDSAILEPLAPYDVMLWPDNDPPGKKYMAAIGQRLHELGIACGVITWPEAPQKADAYDYLQLHDLITLEALMASATAFEPQSTTAITSINEPDTWRHTEAGNGERFTAINGHQARYNVTRDKWMLYTGTHWQVDHLNQAMAMAKTVVRGMYAEAGEIEDVAKRVELSNWAIKCERERALQAMLNLAKICPEMSLPEESFDSNGWLLNVLNGELNLKTGELQPHNSANLCAKLAPVNYDPQATCEQWLSFLNEIFAGNQSIIEFLQRAVGASLTGTMRDQVLLILHGSGANGKSTFMQTIMHLLGDYATGCEASTLMAGQHGTRNDLAALAGARFITAAESGEECRLDEAIIKRLTGGDRIKARFLFNEYFEFEPAFHVWFATNHKPKIRGTDHAIWRRIRLIPFNVTIPDDQQDKELTEKLAAELSGILNWALAGCLQWQNDDLSAPAEVLAATTSYRNESDAVGRFIEACCLVQQQVQVKASDLREAYVQWCDIEGERALSGKAFGQNLTEREFELVKLNNVWQRLGIGLLTR